MPVHGGRQQFYHVYHIHKIYDLSSDNSIVNNKVTFIKGITTKRKYCKFHLFERLELDRVFYLFFVYIRVKCEGFFFFLPFFSGGMWWMCLWWWQYQVSLLLFTILPVVMLPSLQDTFVYIHLLNIFSISIIDFIFYFDSFYLHRCNKKCWLI